MAKLLDEKEIIERLKKYNNKLSIENIENYNGIKSELYFKCDCGYRWLSNLEYVLSSIRKNGCIKCQKRAKSSRIYTRSNENYLERVENIWGGKIKVLSNYIKGESKIKAMCRICDRIWEPVARTLLRGHGCPKCGHDVNRLSRLKSPEKFIEDLKSRHEERISLIGVYYNSNTKTEFKCNSCENIWLANPSMILNGRGCPKCKFSKGELLISGILDKLNVNFKEQFIIKGLKTTKGGTPRFDFALFKDNKLDKIIEFDGALHFESIERFGGDKRLQSQKMIDNFKDNYCLENNIEMIRIKYTEIDKIDIDYIKKLI